MIIGDRFEGPIGVLLCPVGQMALPLVIVTTLGIAYESFASIPEVQAGLIGRRRRPGSGDGDQDGAQAQAHAARLAIAAAAIEGRA